MKKSSFYVLGAIAVLASATIVSADPTWQTYGGHSYALTDTALSWADAEAQAVAWGGHLVIVNDAAENTWLASTFHGTDPGVPYPEGADINQYWIGLRQIGDPIIEPAGNWAWIDGSAHTPGVDWGVWGVGQPNNSNTTPENWATLRGWGWSASTQSFGTWNDASASHIWQGIVESQIVHAPVPAGILLAGVGAIVASRLKRKGILG